MFLKILSDRLQTPVKKSGGGDKGKDLTFNKNKAQDCLSTDVEPCLLPFEDCMGIVFWY